jgi:hypothetical protein
VGGDVECRAQWKQEMESVVSRILIFFSQLVKSVQFLPILTSLIEFIRVWSNFSDFQVFNLILHIYLFWFVKS